MSANTSANLTRPCLLLMKGFPATGKSQLAHALSRRLHWPLVDKDDIKDVILPLPDSNALSYAIMWNVTGRQLQLGVSVIVDSPLTYPDQFETAAALADRCSAALLVVETQLPEAIWKQRLEDRDPSLSQHKIAGWKAMQQMLASYNGCWRYPIPNNLYLLVDTTEPVQVLVDQVISRLSAAIADVVHLEQKHREWQGPRRHSDSTIDA